MELKNTKILVESIHVEEDEKQNSIKYLVNGHKSSRDNRFYIFYDEPVESGLGNTKTLLKYDGDVIVLKRTGEVEQELLFKKDKLCFSTYRTAYGSLFLEVETVVLDVFENDNLFTFYVEYFMTINKEKTGIKKLRVLVGEDIDSGH